MLPSSTAYGLALPRTHRREFRFNVYTPEGEVLAEAVPIGSGRVRVSQQNRVTRTADFTASAEWFPWEPDAPLSPYHAIVQIYAGIGFPTGESEIFPIFRGRVMEATLGSDGEVSFRADDLAAEVVAADFERAYTATSGWSTITEMQRIITDAWPWAQFGANTAIDSSVPVITWDDDRGKALDDLASSLGARWCTDGEGRFVVLRYPYFNETPVKTMRDGANGTLTDAEITISADESANGCIVISERTDAAPVRTFSRDQLPASPSRYGGPFGKRLMRTRVQTPLTYAQAQEMSNAQLSASAALSRTWRVQCVPDFTLEPGDTVKLLWRGLEDNQVIDSLTYSLSPQDPMDIEARASTSIIGIQASELPIQ